MTHLPSEQDAKSINLSLQDRIKKYTQQASVVFLYYDGASYPALYHAVTKRDYEAMQALIADGAEVNERVLGGPSTILTHAVWDKYDEGVKLLIASGARVNSQKGDFALNVATHYGDCQMMQILIENGADVNQAARFDDEISMVCTPLNIAVAYGHADAIKLLIDRGADINHQIDSGPAEWHGLTPLGMAACLRLELFLRSSPSFAVGLGLKQKLEKEPPSSVFREMEFFLEQGANVNLVREGHFSPISQALRLYNTLVRNQDPGKLAALRESFNRVVDVLISRGATLKFEDLVSWDHIRWFACYGGMPISTDADTRHIDALQPDYALRNKKFLEEFKNKGIKADGFVYHLKFIELLKSSDPDFMDELEKMLHLQYLIDSNLIPKDLIRIIKDYDHPHAEDNIIDAAKRYKAQVVESLREALKGSVNPDPEWENRLSILSNSWLLTRVQIKNFLMHYLLQDVKQAKGQFQLNGQEVFLRKMLDYCGAPLIEQLLNQIKSSEQNPSVKKMLEFCLENFTELSVQSHAKDFARGNDEKSKGIPDETPQEILIDTLKDVIIKNSKALELREGFETLVFITPEEYYSWMQQFWDSTKHEKLKEMLQEQKKVKVEESAFYDNLLNFLNALDPVVSWIPKKAAEAKAPVDKKSWPKHLEENDDHKPLPPFQQSFFPPMQSLPKTRLSLLETPLGCDEPQEIFASLKEALIPLKRYFSNKDLVSKIDELSTTSPSYREVRDWLQESAQPLREAINQLRTRPSNNANYSKNLEKAEVVINRYHGVLDRIAELADEKRIKC